MPIIAALTSWPVFLGAIVLVFAVHETWALATGHQPLTGWIRTTTKRFPIMIFFLGLAVGWSSTHFWGGMPCQ